MFPHYRTAGIVLKRSGRDEADQSLTIYTREFGRIDVIARSSRKISSKLRPAIESDAILEIGFIQGRSNKTLIDAVITDPLPEIKGNAAKISIFREICEFAEKILKEQQADARAWELINSTLSFLGSEGVLQKSGEAVLQYFIWHLFTTAGWRAEFGDKSGIGAQNLAWVRFFQEKDIEQASRARLTKRQEKTLLEFAARHLARATN